MNDRLSHSMILDTPSRRNMTCLSEKPNLFPTPISRWIPNENVSKCFGCGEIFTMFIRRHHCRTCGRIFCYSCTENKTQIPEIIKENIPMSPEMGYMKYGLSKEFLKMNGMPTFSVISWIAFAIFKECSRLSITQGPAIRPKPSSPNVTFFIDTIFINIVKIESFQILFFTPALMNSRKRGCALFTRLLSSG